MLLRDACVKAQEALQVAHEVFRQSQAAQRKVPDNTAVGVMLDAVMAASSRAKLASKETLGILVLRTAGRAPPI